MKTELTYPTLDLYLYLLRQGLEQGPEQVEQNRENFKQLLPPINGQLFDQKDETGKYPEFEELLEGQSETRDISWWPSSLKLELDSEWCYPVRMEDSYGVLFDCSLKSPRPAEELTWLQQWKGPFEEKLKLFSEKVATEIQLGHTWMFSAVVPESLSEADKENLAQRCYAALVADADWKKDLVGTGSFLGGTVFELRVRSHEHCLLVFYPKEETARNTVAYFYQDWLPLFCYRHKILWASQNGRILRKALEDLAIKMKRCRTDILQYTMPHLNDEKLQEKLGAAEEISCQYTTKLGKLEVQSHTIEVNLENYQARLSTMEAKKPGILLDCLRKFVTQTGQPKYKQVQKDLAGFRPSLQVWDRLISSLRVRLEMETGKRERRLQHTVSYLGVALTAGAIMASISGQFPTATSAFNETAINNHWLGWLLITVLKWIFSWFSLSGVWLSPGISVLISFGVAILAGGLTVVVIWLWPKLWKRRKKSGV